jgi:hypothetical protein
MLRMFIDTRRNGIERLSFAPPYDWLIAFVALEVGTDLRNARFWTETVRKAAAGETTRDVSGSTFVLDADATTTELESPDRKIWRVPTPILLEALERWLKHLEQSGIGRG